MVYWYRPDEMSIRLLYFYALGNFSQVISVVLAYAFDTISGRNGLSGWQWYDKHLFDFDVLISRQAIPRGRRYHDCFRHRLIFYLAGL